MSAFSSSQAKALFDESFGVPARTILAGAGSASSSTAVYNDLGKLWASTKRTIERLQGEHAHVPAEDRTIAEDVEEAVMERLDQLHAELEPKVSGATLYRRWTTSVRKAMDLAEKMAIAGAAANRAAAEAHMNPPKIPISTPAKPQGSELADQALNDGSQGAQVSGSLVGTLLSRMNATAATNTQVGGTVGNGMATETKRAGSVAPHLAHAAARLLNPGPPALRVEPVGAEIYDHMLREAYTLTSWVEAQGLKGDQGYREAKTIARSVELAVYEYGESYLTSKAGEVQARRLLALVLHAKQGSWQFAELVEELPGSHATSCMPRSLMRQMQEDYKVISKIPGFKPEK